MNEFINKFNEWVKDKTFQFDPVVVNRKFKILNKPYNPAVDKDFVDYNHCVDDILQISPPYNYCADKKTKGGNSKAFEVGSSGPSQLQTSQITNTQRSIVPIKKKIHTIKFDASPHQLVYEIPDDKEIEQIEKTLSQNGPMTRLNKKKSSNFSITDIKNTTQRQIENEDLFNKANGNGTSQNLSQILNMYNLPNNDDGDNNPYDVNFDTLFLNQSQNQNSNMMLRSNSRITRSIPRRPNLQFNGKSLSGFSNFSNNDDNRGITGHGEGSNIFNMHGSLNGALGNGIIKIQANDINRFDIDENQINNLPDIPNIGGSRNNSFQQLYKSDNTPALFRNGSSIIDPKMLRKN